MAQWYRHYARALGPENLYVIAHGPDPEIARICPGASVLTIPRVEWKAFDRMRSRHLNQFQRWLAGFYDWIIRTDADELICLDPARYGSFADLLAQEAEAPALFSLGFNLVEAPDDPDLPPDGPVFAARRHVDLSGNYSKAWVVRGDIGLQLHGIKLRAADLGAAPFVLPRGVYLAHLKYANLEATRSSDTVRETVTGAIRPKAEPGRGWHNASAETAGYLAAFFDKPRRPWDTAEPEVHETLATRPRRLRKFGVLKARAFRFDFRTDLPDWFAKL